ncbi:hypothetical protein GNF10_04305 [Nostoc sp. UCD121]|uniref:hypothetical protein n=1 Tax=unclassified Nostoc TaxID=2593658 RepID=UPI001626A088|nr:MULTISPECIES: hypothetical protein [unclassified Nostoc]MBC1222439.1 hypothetical protein [Nostoc sp. UCD120]MBC1275225.1 hypothetical protein [Nostoc sp. UCD121]MBC1298808.1 hypothetical protein [Nostoc sp. UCD122]
MKLIQIIKVAVIPVLTVLSLLSASNKALADYLTSQGSGGDYRYELWATDNNDYYLKVWSSEASQNSDAYSTTRAFTSSREALIYFDCNYAGRNLPECSQ